MTQSHSETPRDQKEASEKAFGLMQSGPSQDGQSQGVTSPEPIHWSQRMLPMKEAFEVSGRSSSSYYRDVQAGRMPAPVPVGGSSRVPGWELQKSIADLIAARDEVEAAATGPKTLSQEEAG